MAKPGKSAERRERLAAALRENLKRRKARLRAGAAEEAETPAEAAVHSRKLPAAAPKGPSKPG
ncbi:MAG TPA: hypothetical protein VGC27_12185 [Rhizomicrobium sp.]